MARSVHGKTVGVGFIAASLTLTALFAASASPIPLYGLYRSANGLTYSDLSLTAVVYFAGAISALLIFGRLSNHIGRRPVTLLALGLATTACLFLLNVSSVTPLLAGRLLLGAACGLASSATATYVVDTAPSSPHWLAPAVASNAPMLGLTLGALGSGVLADYGPAPRVLPYLVVMGLLAVCAALVWVSPETVTRNPGALASLRPQFSLPKTVRKLFPVVGCIFVVTWALGGFYQAFGPSMAIDQLGQSNAFVAAIVFASLMAPNVIGGPLATRHRPATVLRVGMVVYFLAVMGVLAALRFGMVASFLMASAVAGIAQGMTLTGGMRSLLSGASLRDRAGIFSVVYVTSYCGAALPSFIAGQLARKFSLFQVAVSYGVLAGLGCLVTLLWAGRDE